MKRTSSKARRMILAATIGLTVSSSFSWAYPNDMPHAYAATQQQSEGWLVAPNSLERLLVPSRIVADVEGSYHEAYFLLQAKDGKEARLSVQREGSRLYGNLDAKTLHSLGTSTGSIALFIDGKEKDRVPVLFNIPEPVKQAGLVDDFDSYYGDDALLASAYAKNAGAGCDVSPALSSKEKESGAAGLAFHYQLVKNGYAGIIKNLGHADWSKFDAVRFWLKPDGRGQKLIVQINTGGEDFEVDLTDYAKSSKAQVVTLPFSAFKGKQGGTFNPAAVQHFAIYCNNNSNTPVDSVMYFDNIRAVTTGQASGIKPTPENDTVLRTKTAHPKHQIALSSLSLPKSVSLVDSHATAETKSLAAFLYGIQQSPYVLYGHQNDMHHKAGSAKLSESDTFDMTGDYPAVVGFDFQALEHGDFDLTPAEEKDGLTLDEKMARILEKGNKAGAIFTASAHMPNFDVVNKKGTKQGVYDYTGYTTPVTVGSVVTRIMPGGDLNEAYRGYLDHMASFAKRVSAAGIPIICRLFHENDGSWFWWGATHCSPAQYKNLYRYTVTYLRDQKGVHNLLYAYSPGGPIKSLQDFMTRYPGDDYVDLVGFDMYHREPAIHDSFMKDIAQSLDVLDAFAKKHHKLIAVTETGILTNGQMLQKTGNVRKDWFSEMQSVLEKKTVTYFMTWSNDNANTFDEPYMTDASHGHEMVDAFIDFYNNPRAVFASSIPDWRAWQVTTSPHGAEGYILAITNS